MDMDYKINFDFSSNVNIIGNALSGKTTLAKYLVNKLDNAILIENIDVPNYYDYLIDKLNNKATYIIIDDLLTHLTIDERNAFINEAKNKGIIIINITTNSKDLLLMPYIIIINNYEIIMEGSMEAVLSEETLLSHLGIQLPFAYQLSKELKDYDVINQVCYQNKELVDLLWK